MIADIAKTEVCEPLGTERIIEPGSNALVAGIGATGQPALSESVPAESAEDGITRQSEVGQAVASENVQLFRCLMINPHIECIVVILARAGSNEVVGNVCRAS